MTISNTMTVIGLLNGMIGGIILLMPLQALNSGYILIAPITFVQGFISYFSCLLCLRHLRNFKDLDEAILYHFQGKKIFKIGYDLTIALSLIFLLVLYFGLICQQWKGLLGIQCDNDNNSNRCNLIQIFNALMLVPLVYFMKKFDFGSSLLAYGILSILGYCMFLIYFIISAPSGQNKVKPTDQNFVQLTAALAQGFAIQTFFIPIMRQNVNRRLYPYLLFLTYFLGGCIYCFIGYSGAYSIVNRNGGKSPNTIENYLQHKSPQGYIIQILYLIHLYSAYPQFLLVAKKRFFSIFQWSQPRLISLKEIIFVVATIVFCLGINLIDIQLQIIIDINGAILSFIFIQIIPISLHLKCVYFSQKNEHLKFQNEIQKEGQEMQIRNTKRQNNIIGEKKQCKSEIFSNTFNNKINNSYQVQNYNAEDQNQNNKNNNNNHFNHYICKSQSIGIGLNKPQIGSMTKQQFFKQMQVQPISCNGHYKSKKHEYCEIFLIFIMVISGVGTMIYTIFQLNKKK